MHIFTPKSLRSESQNKLVYFHNEALVVIDMFLRPGVGWFEKQLGTQIIMWYLHLGTNPCSVLPSRIHSALQQTINEDFVRLLIFIL